MNIVKKLALGLAFAASFSATAFASVVQTSSGGSYYGYQAWGSHEIGKVTFATGTNTISALTTSVDLRDQGWGGQCDCNQVYIALFDTENKEVWAQHVAGAVHGWTNQVFDITTDVAAFDKLNAAMGALDYSTGGIANVKMFASPVGWGGWSLEVKNAGMSIASDAVNVPEPASLALLGLGLLGLTASRRKFGQK
ncbi:MAG: PEP-CTERM sorting domain-containing protein [Bdellovibrionales bacterium]|nr:PEP-CTERM sorting domain-containing protein [Massilia sp.]